MENYRAKRMAEIIRGKNRVLDIGYGDFPNRFLNNQEVIGLDIKKSQYPENYSSRVIGDATALPAPFGSGTFDAILAGEIIEHLEKPLDFLRGCFQALEPSGMLVLSTPNPNSPIERLLTLSLSEKYFYTSDHVCLYPQRWLIRMLSKVGYQNIKLLSGGFPFPFIGTIPFPRPWCYQTIATGTKPSTLTSKSADTQ